MIRGRQLTQPFATIQAAANIVNPGTIRCGPASTTRRSTRRAGQRDHAVSSRRRWARRDPRRVGPAFQSPTGADGGGIYSLPFAGATRVVCVDSLMRLYNQANLAALQTNALGVNQGFTVDTGRLYVKLEGGISPIGHKVHVARFNTGMFIDNSYWHVTGFEVRYFGTGSGGSGIYDGRHQRLIENNHVHTMGGKPIFLRSMASDCLIEHNRCRDPRIYSWPWNATKGHNEENAALSNRGGRGVVVRFNVCQGTTDGVDTGGDDGVTENIGVDFDIHDNTITLMGDDALEPETTSGINVRVWHNRVDNVFSGCSIAPNTVGPTYVLYNTITNYQRGGFKFSLSGTAQIWICHNTVTSTVPGAPAVHPSGPYSNIHFRNNILVGNGSAAVSDDAGESQTGNDYDADSFASYCAVRWKGVNYSSLSALRSGTGFETLGRAGDPLFVAPGNGDYMPGPASPAIDGGIRLPGINDTYNGAAPDMGAIEFGIPGVDVVPPAAIRDLN
jgi:hypothetical protein